MSECQHGRHKTVTLHAGRGCKQGMFCVSGRVKVCRNCRVCIEGEPGSQYFNGASLIVINASGRAVWSETVSHGERQRMVDQARAVRRMSAGSSESTPAWSLGD